MEHFEQDTGYPAVKSATRGPGRALISILAAFVFIAALIAGCSLQLSSGKNADTEPHAPANAAAGNNSEKPVPAETAQARQQQTTSPGSDPRKDKTKAEASEPQAKSTEPDTGTPKTDIAPAPSPKLDGATGNSGAVPAAAPEHLTIEAAGVDVAIHPLTPAQGAMASQSIVPPFTLDGYWLTPYGKPGQGSQNTTYITGHSWSDRKAPFDRLSTDTEVGDKITLLTTEGALHYVIDSITTHNKETLKTSDIWNVVPNRLVLVSCYTQDPTGRNVVVTASPA